MYSATCEWRDLSTSSCYSKLVNGETLSDLSFYANEERPYHIIVLFYANNLSSVSGQLSHQPDRQITLYSLPAVRYLHMTQSTSQATATLQDSPTSQLFLPSGAIPFLNTD